MCAHCRNGSVLCALRLVCGVYRGDAWAVRELGCMLKVRGTTRSCNAPVRASWRLRYGFDVHSCGRYPLMC